MLIYNSAEGFTSNFQIDFVVNDYIDSDLNAEFDAVAIKLVVGLNVVDELELIAPH